MQEEGGLAGARCPGEMRGAWNLCEGESSNKTQGHLLIAQESRKKGTCEDGIFEVENRNAFIEVCISFVIVLHLNFIYLFGKCLLHRVRDVHSAGARNSQSKDKVAAR